jgi:hypothetical protein
MVSVTGFPSRVIWTWTEPRPCAAAMAVAALAGLVSGVPPIEVMTSPV